MLNSVRPWKSNKNAGGVGPVPLCADASYKRSACVCVLHLFYMREVLFRGGKVPNDDCCDRGLSVEIYEVYKGAFYKG